MQEQHHILICAGTRPELIKLAPLYHELNKRPHLAPSLCLTGQHESLVRDLPRSLNICPDHIFKRDQFDHSQLGLIKGVFQQLTALLQVLKPRLMLVQGDTASALTAAMTARQQKIPVAHIEAGLRTRDILSPFPEELYRQLISRVGRWHFCPTKNNRASLIEEDIPEDHIYVCGSTSIDAVLQVPKKSRIPLETKSLTRPYFLITLHRREVQGETLVTIVEALRRFAGENPGFDFRVTVHPSPAVRRLLHHYLTGADNIFLLTPLDYRDFVPLMKNAYAILSDSGGIQEEAPALNVPVIVFREKTERQEGVRNGCLRLAGHDPEKIFSELALLIHDQDHYKRMSRSPNPFGDGQASRNICDILDMIITGQYSGNERPNLPS
ncbi:non-hydrolyzing UDP-N-acetylglucosamine 2-epimerase [Emcibacter sp.]|uniref:non-hydrolyzing UDP-N-acetylglucosamine 2-epimerase n=1 Tax=Emcibacter sp. TaxID=1979954 RepID=UPI002AA6DCE7|nr:UDP-N-acetylglucosamine 2-epimerase (non-hydrolyzing) [Emcibacter sp.]